MAASRPESEARYWRSEGELVHCGLCHRRCAIAPGRSGACRVRMNEGGRLSLPYYGLISAAAVDPIEKKPLYHFLPGSAVYSVGYLGCNLRCPFCQNHHIAQDFDAEAAAYASSERLARAALASGAPSLAHTYSEPLIHIEYVMAAMREARALGLKNVLVTNGSVAAEPARDVLALCDAVNLDIKAWDPAWYREGLGGDRDEALAFARAAYESGVHLEVTTLVVPGRNDTDEDIEGIADFLAGLGADIPYHLSAYHPAWRYREPATPVSTLRRLKAVAERRLRYVHLGNVPGFS